MDVTRPPLRSLVALAVEAGLAAVDARRATRDMLRTRDLRAAPGGRLVVAGWGKAALPMLEGALAALGGHGLAPDVGLVVVKQGQARGGLRIGEVEVREAAHPVPDERSAAAGHDLLALAASLRDGDAFLALSSGGGTSLLATPIPPATLRDLQAALTRLLRDGSDVATANATRRELSAVAGGRLARAAGRARSLTLVVSDVPGDDPHLVASGPMAEAGHEHVVVARPADAVRAAAAELSRQGVRVLDSEEDLQGDAADAAGRIAERLASTCAGASAGERVGLVLGGETTVRLAGAAPGGRNGHLAACAALRLGELGIAASWSIACVATDGDDGSSGTGGALVDDRSAERWRRADLDARAALAACGSLALLRASGDTWAAGDTGTNVADLVVAVAERA